jgi:hypothetical protein
MKKVIIDYGKKTAVKVVSLARTAVVKLTVNANFPDLPVLLANITAQAVRTENAITAAADKSRTALAVLRAEKETLAEMLRTTAEYVNTTAAGNEAVLLTSGFEISKTPETNQQPTAITGIEAFYTNIAGTIRLLWKGSRHVRYFNVFMSVDNGQTWTMLNTVIGRRLLVEQLVSGTRYQFKVIPVGVAGVGPASDIASQIAA